MAFPLPLTMIVHAFLKASDIVYVTRIQKERFEDPEQYVGAEL